jgi:hypothetical protein
LEPPEVEMPVFCKAEAVPISEKTGISHSMLARSGGTGVWGVSGGVGGTTRGLEDSKT